jgi:hypothetical protein
LGFLFLQRSYDVARVSVPVTTATDSLEALSMVLPQATMSGIKHGMG